MILQEYFGSRDFLNFTYHIKRAYYVCGVAIILKQGEIDLDFTIEDHDQMKPMLIAYMKEGRKFEINNRALLSLFYMQIKFVKKSL